MEWGWQSIKVNQFHCTVSPSICTFPGWGFSWPGVVLPCQQRLVSSERLQSQCLSVVHTFSWRWLFSTFVWTIHKSPCLKKEDTTILSRRYVMSFSIYRSIHTVGCWSKQRKEWRHDWKSGYSMIDEGASSELWSPWRLRRRPCHSRSMFQSADLLDLSLVPQEFRQDKLECGFEKNSLKTNNSLQSCQASRSLLPPIRGRAQRLSNEWVDRHWAHWMEGYTLTTLGVYDSDGYSALCSWAFRRRILLRPGTTELTLREWWTETSR